MISQSVKISLDRCLSAYLYFEIEEKFHIMSVFMMIQELKMMRVLRLVETECFDLMEQSMTADINAATIKILLHEA